METAVVGSLERQWLDATTWVDLGRSWLPDADELYRDLVERASWRQGRLWRYDHYVIEPRLTASIRLADYPLLKAAHMALRSHYRVTFDGPALGFYRDGNDALGMHRDRELRYTSDTIIAILTLGARRPWRMRSRAGSREAPGIDLSPASGDLLVMGGRAQADWLHGVPPVRTLRDGRISLQWRWTSGTGPPEKGPGYRAPRHYSRR